VLEEVAVLAGQQGLDQVRRKLLIADDVSFLVAEELRDQAAVAVEDLRRQRRPVALVYVEAANVPRSRARQADGGADRNGDQQADDNPYSGNEGSPPGRRRWRSGRRRVTPPSSHTTVRTVPYTAVHEATGQRR
jgi:hypothetical protein